jgi:hypothetical protein
MNSRAFRDLLDRGESLYGLLLETTDELSRVLGSLDVEGIALYMEKREKILTDIQNFDSELAAGAAGVRTSGAAGDDEPLQRFRKVRGELTKRILDTDATIVASLEERMDEVRGGLLSLARGRKALNGYEGGERSAPRMLEDSI